MLKEYTLFGIRDKVAEAVNTLQEYEPPEGYYVCFSGGKDSLCCYYLCKIAGVKFDAHYNYTTIDPPELVRFIRTFDDVEFCHPEKCFWDLIVQKGMPPTRLARYCCKELKEKGGSGRIKVMGVREEESAKRKGRKVVMIDGESPLGRVINIIYHWTEEEVWEFIGCNLIDYCSLYDEGYGRLGCIGCQFGGTKKQEKDFERWPAYKRAYIKTFDKMILESKKKGRKTTWETGQEVFDWWVYGRTKENKNQLNIFNKESEAE